MRDGGRSFAAAIEMKPVPAYVHKASGSGIRHSIAGAGDLLVTVEVLTPVPETPEQRAAIEALAEAFPGDPRAEFLARADQRGAS